jgi:hypothetical protein
LNINFSSVSTPNVLTQITKIKQFKPFEEIKEICTSLEEWALHILQPDQEFQLKELYDNDPETAQRWDRVMEGKKLTTFKITTKIFTAAKAVISLPQYTNTQIQKRLFFFCAKVFFLRNRLLCICVAKKVICLDRYTDKHTK